jgi:transcription antitermination factor NusG
MIKMQSSCEWLLAKPMNDLNWMAVYTRPNSEKKLTLQLAGMSIETYCPLHKVERQWSDRKKIIEEPIFKSYVFLRPTKEQVWQVMDLPNVVNYVYWLGKHAIIRNEEIETIKLFLNEYPGAIFQKETFATGDTIIVRGGLLMHQEGIITEVRGSSVKVIIKSLGGELVANLKTNNVVVKERRSAALV